MKFQPKSEADIKTAALLPPGEYDAEIGTAEDTVSKSGNEMIKLDLTVFDTNGGKRFIYDYLLESMAYKLRHAAEACGLLAKYEQGLLTADDFIGKGCRVKIGIDDKVAANKKNGTDYPPSNMIKDYIIEGGSKSQRAKVAEIKAEGEKAFEDSTIPF